jgi:two-component system LytT family sensor kinase
MSTENTALAPLAPRVALLSIAGFWAFYFVIWSVRGAVLYHHNQASMLGTRAIVSLASAAVTVLFYLLIRRASTTRPVRNFALALLLAIPAALSYSTINWYTFDHLGEGESMRWNWTPAASKRQHLPPAPHMMAVGVGMMPPRSDDDMTPLQSIADQAANGYFFFIAWAALYLALSYAAEVGALERRAAVLRAAAQSAELRALRYQVNPHFLFNTLNSLSALVLAGKREQAERMIINLATFFRTSLTGDPTEDVRLSEEIALQRLYLDIERVRFPDRLLVEIDVPDGLLAACIPGLILQPLVENAVKYAVSRARRAVTIRISAQQNATGLSLAVEDDGEAVGHVVAEAGTGVGLRNVRDRLSARYGEAATCDWGARPSAGFAVMLTLPLVRDGC